MESIFICLHLIRHVSCDYINVFVCPTFHIVFLKVFTYHLSSTHGGVLTMHIHGLQAGRHSLDLYPQIPTVPPTTKRPVVTSSEIIPPEKDYFGKSTQAENAKTPTRLTIETHSHVAFLHKLCSKFYLILLFIYKV